jgi:hypothetical protein
MVSDSGAWAMNVISSVGIIMANKQVMSGYKFHFGNTSGPSLRKDPALLILHQFHCHKMNITVLNVLALLSPLM